MVFSDRFSPDSRHPLTVGELTRAVRLALESSFSLVHVIGEVSNCKFHSSGHTYFTLKDEQAQIGAVIWRSKSGQTGLVPSDGARVIATGRLTVYEARGVYQLDVQFLRPVGLGDLQQRFEELKRKLAAEGLFEQARKRPLPPFPERVGIVTSPTGAVLRDIVQIIRRRFPGTELILAPARVQGSGAAGEIADALKALNEHKAADVIILARGGGSLEDLWVFNEEQVARAIASSAIPVVSAVGHETDFTISDFVSDLRAPTPSAAAELVVKDRSTLVDTLHNLSYTMTVSIHQMLDQRRRNIQHLLSSYSLKRPFELLRQANQRHDDLERGLATAMQHVTTLHHARLEGVYRHLFSLNPLHTLKRGYAIVHKDGEVMTSSGEASSGDTLAITFHDGTIDSKVL
jgi:exodeoxyribonuclease VII large subunit